MSNEINEAMGKALQIMYEAEEAINSVTPAERRKCNAIIKKYIGEPASKYGFQLSPFERAKDMVHEWFFDRTVDAVSQSIVIREQPLARGELRLLCCGCAETVETTAIYDKTVEGFEEAVIELKQFLENEAYDRFEKAVQNDDRIKGKDYEDLYENYLSYAEAFMKNNGLTEDKFDCCIVRTLKERVRTPFSIVGSVLLFWERGIKNVSVIDHLTMVYTTDEYKEFLKEIGR